MIFLALKNKSIQVWEYIWSFFGPVGIRVRSAEPSFLKKICLQFRGDDPLIYRALRHPNAVVIARMNNGSVSIDKMVCQARISA